MGFMDDVRKTQQDKQATASAPRITAPDCVGLHYVTEVNKGSINMDTWQRHLNEMYEKGYRLAHVLEQKGNTVQVFEHYRHS